MSISVAKPVSTYLQDIETLRSIDKATKLLALAVGFYQAYQVVVSLKNIVARARGKEDKNKANIFPFDIDSVLGMVAGIATLSKMKNKYLQRNIFVLLFLASYHKPIQYFTSQIANDGAK